MENLNTSAKLSHIQNWVLSENSENGVLNLTNEVKQQLNIKHPESRPKFDPLLLHGPINEIHEVVFDKITNDLIQKTAIRTKGVTGPSEFNADDWRRILGSNVFRYHSLKPRKSLARMTKKLYSRKTSCHESLEALLASQLIPLNKSPGARPIGIGEVLQRIIGKAVMSVVKKEIVQAAGSLQVCAGQVAGVESAIHCIVDLFESDNSAAVLHNDATNALNSLNRNVFVNNI